MQYKHPIPTAFSQVKCIGSVAPNEVHPTLSREGPLNKHAQTLVAVRGRETTFLIGIHTTKTGHCLDFDNVQVIDHCRFQTNAFTFRL